jgi:hypothetical protein
MNMNDIVKQEQSAEIVSINPEMLIMKGIESNIPVESLERLLAMRQTLKEEQAKEAFFNAMANFQADCPVIKKNKKVLQKNSSQVRYSYASLDSIVSQISPFLKKYGLSYMFKSTCQDGAVIQSCEVHHILGHVETSSFSIPIDADGYMGDAQKSGSASSFAKRYALTDAFGILTGDQDDDAQSLGGNQTPQDLYKKFSRHMAAVMDNIETVTAMKGFLAADDFDGAAEAWSEIDHVETMKALSLAPTKGGCFTIEEKQKMNSDEFKKFNAIHREGQEIEGL